MNNLIVCLCVGCLLNNATGFFLPEGFLSNLSLNFSRSSTRINQNTNNCSCTSICMYGSSCKYSCNYPCQRVGTRKRKRIPQNFIELLLPCKFETWDMDKDGYVRVEEFAFIGHAKVEDPNTGKLFRQIDYNNDGLLSKNELMSAPLKFEKCWYVLQSYVECRHSYIL